MPSGCESGARAHVQCERMYTSKFTPRWEETVLSPGVWPQFIVD